MGHVIPLHVPREVPDVREGRVEVCEFNVAIYDPIFGKYYEFGITVVVQHTTKVVRQLSDSAAMADFPDRTDPASFSYKEVPDARIDLRAVYYQTVQVRELLNATLLAKIKTAARNAVLAGKS